MPLSVVTVVTSAGYSLVPCSSGAKRSPPVKGKDTGKAEYSPTKPESQSYGKGCFCCGGRNWLNFSWPSSPAQASLKFTHIELQRGLGNARTSPPTAVASWHSLIWAAQKKVCTSGMHCSPRYPRMPLNEFRRSAVPNVGTWYVPPVGSAAKTCEYTSSPSGIIPDRAKQKNGA